MKAMKNVKRLLAVLLAVAMMMSMSLIALAANDDYSITIKYAASGHTYSAYQVFSGDLSEDGVLSNIEWGTGVSKEDSEKVSIYDELKKITKSGENVPVFATAVTNEENNGITYDSLTSAAQVAEILATYNNDSDVAQKFAAVVAKYVNNSTKVESVETDGSKTDSDGNTSYEYTISNLDAGYYLVVDTTDNENITDGSARTRYILEVVKNVTIEAKADTVEVDKDIVDGDSTTDAASASIGDTVNFRITGTLPENYADYKLYYYQFNDTLSQGLTYVKDSLKVYVVNKSGEKKEFTQATGTENIDYKLEVREKAADDTAITAITVTFDDLKVTSHKDSIAAGSTIVVEYSATLNEDAVIAGDGNDNTVTLTYSNNPNYDSSGEGGGTSTTPPTGETPESRVEVYTTEITILKTDEKNNVLQGAEFTLTGGGVKTVVVTGEVFVQVDNDDVGSETVIYYELQDGAYTTTSPQEEGIDTSKYVKNDKGDYTKYIKKEKVTITSDQGETVGVTGWVDSNGKLTFTGLGAGDYTLSETKTPAGYNTIDDIEFTINFDFKSKTFSTNNNNVNAAGNTLSTTVVNNSGSLLPSTGGVGTQIFYVLGVILVAGAGVLLVTKRRMNAEK